MKMVCTSRRMSSSASKRSHSSKMKCFTCRYVTRDDRIAQRWRGIKTKDGEYACAQGGGQSSALKRRVSKAMQNGKTVCNYLGEVEDLALGGQVQDAARRAHGDVRHLGLHGKQTNKQTKKRGVGAWDERDVAGGGARLRGSVGAHLERRDVRLTMTQNR